MKIVSTFYKTMGETVPENEKWELETFYNKHLSQDTNKNLAALMTLLTEKGIITNKDLDNLTFYECVIEHDNYHGWEIIE